MIATFWQTLIMSASLDIDWLWSLNSGLDFIEISSIPNITNYVATILKTVHVFQVYRYESAVTKEKNIDIKLISILQFRISIFIWFDETRYPTCRQIGISIYHLSMITSTR